MDNVFTSNDNTSDAYFNSNLIGEFALDEDENFVIYGGIYNLFDSDPPFSPKTRNVSDPIYYDVLGRRFTIGARLNF